MIPPIEPFRIKSVEPLRTTTRSERRGLLEEAGYNLFELRADDVLVDLLTDSGTSAMSSAQWSALMRGDESYAGASSWFRFESAVQALMPLKHVIPCHQGRAAERILFQLVGGPDRIVPSNTHFDTTRANAEASGARAVDLVVAEARDPSSLERFKGNIDLARLEQLLRAEGDRIPLVLLTVTNNGGGGQPVSLDNIRRTKALCRRFDVPLFIDACRFAENAWFIKCHERACRDLSIPEIARAMFSEADGVTMSAKKDGLANIGGWLALNDDELAERARQCLVVTEGFPTYGGLAGRDLEAIAVGLQEVVQEKYLAHRISSVRRFGEALVERGIPILLPVGGHAVYVDAGRLLPHVPALEYPGQALAAALYEIGGVRGCEIGSVMFGLQPDGTERPAAQELVRLAVPRRTYTQSHLEYVAACFEEIAAKRDELRGMRIESPPSALRHFSARFAPLPEGAGVRRAG